MKVVNTSTGTVFVELTPKEAETHRKNGGATFTTRDKDGKPHIYKAVNDFIADFMKDAFKP